ncbi:MAG: hypothetical protein JAZ07_22550 [Candidatus Thiodiazotropha endolucinida]|uniref:Uncharacterized protein n=1 Tax=Candidatus Thiodiazotropha taylori TaxID=2792791 RepID=A0A9E4T8X0_9GAMM|nr:hypothetical protein [Candidatus Thiodiazotropha taylori]
MSPNSNVKRIPSSPEPGSLEWRRARGLETLRDSYEPTPWDDENLIALPKRKRRKPAIPIRAAG